MCRLRCCFATTQRSTATLRLSTRVWRSSPALRAGRASSRVRCLQLTPLCASAEAHAAWRPPVVLPRTMALRRVVVCSSARTLELLTAAPGAAFQYVASERGAPDDDDDSCFIVDYDAEPDCVCGACPTLARARCTQAAA